MYILGGSSAQTIAKDLSKKLNQPLAQLTIKRFPDNELYIRVLDDIKNQDVIIVQTTYPDDKIIELFLLQNAVQEAGATKIWVVIPYFGYGRQDKQFNTGEPISAKTLAEHISMNADHILTVDPHKQHLLKFFTIPAHSCSPTREIANYLKTKHIDYILAPDKGAQVRAEQIAQLIGCEYNYLEKTRIDDSTVEIQTKHLDVNKKKVAIVDDIISTGGTMAKSITELKKQGATKIHVACTHGLFIGDAEQKIRAAGCDEIISTDTIYNKFSCVHCAPCLAQFF